MKICLVEISAIVPATGAIQTIRLSSVGASSSAVILDGNRWLPFLTETPQTTVKVVEDGRINLTVDHGRIAFAAVGSAAAWRDLMFDGARARVFVGEEGAPFSAYEQHFEGTCGAHTTEKSIVSIPLVGRGDRLEKTNLLTSSFAGTGGVEGTSDIAGNLKPVAFGRCLNIEPVLVDAAKQVYQVHDGAIDDIEMVFENALAVNSAPLTAANASALYSMSIPEGQWAKCPAAGIFRLGGQPSGLVTADVRGAKIGGVYSSNIATIATAILTRAGVLSAHIDPVTFAAFGDKSWSLYADTQMSVWEAVTTAFAHAAGIVFADETGVFRAGSYLSNATPTTLMADRSSLPLVITGTTKQLEVSPPVWRLKYGHSRAWRVHTTSEISKAIADISADQAANDAKAQAALDAAALAQAQADVARAEYASMVADGVLDRAEKIRLMDRIQGYTVERPVLMAEAAAQNVTSEAQTYDTAYLNLMSYLNGLAPAYYDTGVDTSIDGATYVSRLVTYDVRKTALLTAIANRAAQTAGWGGVTGPGKPADNATVGAPSGTPVGNSTADEVVNRIETARQRIDGLVTATAEMVAKIGAIPVDATVAQEIERVAAEKSNAALSSASALVEQASIAAASSTNAVAQRTSTLEASYTGLNGRVEGVEGGLSSANARITDEAVTAANATGAVASRTSNLESSVGGLSSRVSTTEGSISNLNGRTAAFWQTQTVAGNNRAQLSIYADANGGAGVDIVGDVAISGNLMVGGSISTGKIANNAVTRMASFYSSCSHSFGSRTKNQWYELSTLQLVDYDQEGNPIYSGQSARLVFTGLVSNSSVMLNVAIDHYRTGSNDDTWGARVIRRRYGNDPVQVGDSYMVRSRSGYTITTLPFMDVVSLDGDYSYQIELARYGDGGFVDYVNLSGIIGQK
ncbi:hypothetical protein WSK_2083 [Novosphingobium sp. Rr 2-17]|uniref:hypothetical protein n=1 Tax=Novosphingobium sp. Rr 2-17 TaxID=555793 RepID=UPI0002698BA7|nr:hypothetical protein [Novosphingobium sp. Rr 2-17]EIZ79238.1 hypothetical protein WSK_2083 [Novosphingobium sp. Rr 2-17]